MNATVHAPARTLERDLGEGKAVYSAARARAAALAEVGHPAVTVPVRILAKEGGHVVAQVPHLDGVDLSQVLHLKGPLRAGQCVAMGMEVADALAAMHAAGLAHGDLSPANVMLVNGHMVLVDTIAGALTHEAGTAPFAAPERAEGASPEGDIYSLGMMLLDCVRCGDWDLIEAWARPMIDPNPAARPQASMVARALASCAEPEAIELPPLDVAQAVRARALGPDQVTTRIAAGSWWRVRQGVSRWAVVAAVTVAFFVAGIAGMAWVQGPPEQPARLPANPAMPVPNHAAEDVEAAAARVTVQRFAALAAGDAESLVATTSPAGQARVVVAAQAAALASGALKFQELGVRVIDVEMLSLQGNDASVAISYGVSAHRVTTADGTVEVSAFEQGVVLDLTWIDGWGWLVENARPPA